MNLIRLSACIGLLLQCLVCLPAYSASAATPHFGLFCPNDNDEFYWKKVLASAEAAANDLDVKLTIRCGQDLSTYEFKRLGSKFLQMTPKLDYFITGYWKGVTNHHIELAHDLGIKVFVFNGDVFAEDYEKVGRRPREKYSNWIGHMVPNDTQAGADLAKILFDHAKNADTYSPDDKKIHAISISGTEDNTVSESRTAGLREQMNKTLFTKLVGNEYAFWLEDSAYRATADLLKKDPDISVVFVVADRMTVGALRAVEESKKKAGKDIFIGSFDWGLLDELEAGRVTASMGGHFLEGAWAIILAYDYHHGYDFAKDTGVRMKTRLFPITRDNIQQYKPLLGKVDWETIDFSRFSKQLNPQLEEYDFDIEQLLN